MKDMKDLRLRNGDSPLSGGSFEREKRRPWEIKEDRLILLEGFDSSNPAAGVIGEA